MRNSVDAVITWVDGNDKTHKTKFNNYFKSLSSVEHIALDEQAWHPTRFHQCDEIKYCLLSIQKFAPWIKKIFLITDNQIPAILHTLPKHLLNKIKIIDHKEIFHQYERNLPTFNSLSIETMLWRIPDLSERFIYFNDDCILIRPVVQKDFFKDNKIIIRGEWKTQSHAKWFTKTPFKSFVKKVHSHRKLQEYSAQLSGFKSKFIHLSHTPFANFKSSYEEYFFDTAKLMENSSYKLRDSKQFWPISVIYHSLVKKNKMILQKKNECIAINGAHQKKDKVLTKLHKAYKYNNTKFLCIQSLDITPEITRDYIYNWLKQQI